MFMGDMETMAKSFYEEWIINNLNKISGFKYEDVSRLDEFPLEISLEVLKVLVGFACESQNDVPIMLGRANICKIDKSWLAQHLIEVAKSCLDLNDEWEYRRLFELVLEAVPELKQEVADIGFNSADDDIKEAAADYLDHLPR